MVAVTPQTRRQLTNIATDTLAASRLRNSCVAPLMLENGQLRTALRREFQGLQAHPPSAVPKFQAQMQEYCDSLLGAVARNESALISILGTPTPAANAMARLRWHTIGRDAGYDRLGSLLRHLAKDWACDGVAGRRELNERILNDLSARASELDAPLRIVVPGCGQGRLSWLIARSLPDAQVTGIESSAAQLSIGVSMMDRQAHSVSFHPFLDEPRNNFDAGSRAVMLSAPDVTTSVPSNLTLWHTTAEAGLERVRADGGADVIVCCFFLDCLPDVPLGLSNIAATLRRRGSLVFAGPLDYHHWPSPSPALSHLLALCDDLGLRLSDAPAVVEAPYPRRPGPSISHEYLWRVPYFVCHKS